MNSLPACSFCGKRDPKEVGRIAAGAEAAICERCLELCEEVLMEQRTPQPFERKWHCSFCGQSSLEVRGRLVAGPAVYICEDCVGSLKRAAR